MSASPPEAEPAGAGYARGARILSVGIASTGVFTLGYFLVAANVLPDDEYGQVSRLWAVLFVILSVLYRPVEQLLSRSIADRRARGIAGGHPLRVPILLQSSFALAFLVIALALKGPVQNAFDGSETLFWILVVAAVAYAASYFARGYVAGHEWFGLYGGLVLFESISRFCFPVAVAVGLASGQTAVALGIAAAPFASLLVIPIAFRRSDRASAGEQRGTLRESGAFAGSVAAIQLAEQTLLNAAVLLVPTSVLAGVVFSALLIARAPLQLFQAVQTSLLPHLAGLEATEGREAFARAVRTTVLAIAGFAAVVAVGLLAVGPLVMELFRLDYEFGRFGLALLAVGMGFHLAAGTFTQALLARARAGAAAGTWLVCAALFVAWMLAGPIGDELVRAEVGYAGATALLAVALGLQARATAGRLTRTPAP